MRIGIVNSRKAKELEPHQLVEACVDSWESDIVPRADERLIIKENCWVVDYVIHIPLTSTVVLLATPAPWR